MRELVKAAEDAVKRTTEEARTAWKAFADAREAAVKEHGPEKVITDATVFEALETVHKSYATAAQAEVDAKTRYSSLIDMLGTSDRKDLGLGHLPTPDDRLAAAAAAASNRKTFGDLLIASPAYQALLKSGRLAIPGTHVDMEPVIIGDAKSAKALLTGASDTSAGAFTIAERQPGYVGLLRAVPAIIDLITVGTTTSDAVDWVEQDARTNNAAETAEATSGSDGALPESTFTLVVRTESVQAIGHFIAATRRAIADAGQLQTLVDSELQDGLRYRLDGQLLAGNGSTPNLRGIVNKSGIQTQALGADSRSDAVHKAITKIRLAFLEPDAIALHPTDSQSIRLEKDADGNYIYGPPSMAEASSMWGLPMVSTAIASQGTGIVGAWRRSATLWLREGVAVSMTDSHSDWFIREMIAVKATLRAAFGISRPAGFCTVTGL